MFDIDAAILFTFDKQLMYPISDKQKKIICDRPVLTRLS